MIGGGVRLCRVVEGRTSASACSVHCGRRWSVQGGSMGRLLPGL
jgi:hypothetical protein